MAAFTPLVSGAGPSRDRPAREFRALVAVAISAGVITLERCQSDRERVWPRALKAGGGR
jgi:hypothetical protein